MNYEYWVLNVKRRLLSSVEKAKMLMGYITEHRQTGFEDGLKKVHAWFVENLGGYRVECGVLITRRNNNRTQMIRILNILM